MVGPTVPKTSIGPLKLTIPKKNRSFQTAPFFSGMIYYSWHSDRCTWITLGRCSLQQIRFGLLKQKDRYLWGRLETVAISLLWWRPSHDFHFDQVVQVSHVWQRCEASMIFHFLWSLMPSVWIGLKLKESIKLRAFATDTTTSFFWLTGWGNCTPGFWHMLMHMDTVSKPTAIYFWRSYLFQTIIKFSIVFFTYSHFWPSILQRPLWSWRPFVWRAEEKINLTPKKRSGLRT